MIKKNLLSGKDRELVELAEQYEKAKAEHHSIYMDADDLADLADWYGVRQNPDMAMEVVDYGLSLHPNNNSLLIEKGYLYLDNYDTVHAQEIANELDSNLSEAKILQAQIHILNGQEQKAKQLLNTIENKEDIDTMINVAYMYVNTQHPHDAFEWLKPGIGEYEDDEPFMTVLGDTYYGMGMLDEAIDIYNGLIDKNPYSSPYWFGLARCYFDKQMYDKTIEACDYATLSDEEFSDAYMMKGHAFFYLQNDEQALENFQIAANLGAVSQCFIDTFIGLSQASQEKWPEAYTHLQKAIDTYEDETIISLSTLYSNAALCLYKMGEKAQSEEYWTMAHEANPEDAEAYLMEGKMYLDEHDFNRCQQCWKKALLYAPNINTWHEIGTTCLEHGKIEQARIAFEKAKSLNPDFYDINEKLAIVYLLLKDKENFQKYNRQCKNPITMADLQRIQEMLKEEDKESLLQEMKKLLNGLQ